MFCGEEWIRVEERADLGEVPPLISLSLSGAQGVMDRERRANSGHRAWKISLNIARNQDRSLPKSMPLML